MNSIDATPAPMSGAPRSQPMPPPPWMTYQALPAGWYPPAPPTSALAVVSLIFGILWVFWIGSFVAVLCGHLALRDIRRKGEGGSGLAIAGLVLGYIGVATFTIYVLFFLAAALSLAAGA